MINSDLQHARRIISLSSSMSGRRRSVESSGEGFQWWYFDAISDDGRDAVVIRFADRSIETTGEVGHSNGSGGLPSVSFAYYCEGRLLVNTNRTFDRTAFDRSYDLPACRIGTNEFRFQEVDYGSGFRIEIKADAGRGRSVEAQFEWLLVESDVVANADPDHGELLWNVAVPRADVSGRVTIADNGKKRSKVYHFRGTGYHDQYLSCRKFNTSVRSLERGRAHFTDATAVFCHHRGFEPDADQTDLLIVRENGCRRFTAQFEVQEFKQNGFGAKYPGRIRVRGSDTYRLRVKPFKIINSSTFTIQLLSEMTLILRDGIPRRTTGIYEMISPAVSRFRLLNWLNRRAGGRLRG
jgi:carotenoid 1,2-hydratase